VRRLVVLLLLSAGPAWARDPYFRRAIPVSLDASADKNWEFQIRPGFSVPRGSLADVAKNSATLHASVERKVNDTLSIGLEAGDNLGHRYEGLDATAGRFTSNVRIGIFQLSPMFKLGFDIPLGYRSLRPYFVTGAGLYVENRNAGTITLLPSGAQRRVEASKARGNVGANVGVGITFRPWIRVRLGGETRYHYYSQEDDLDGDTKKRDAVRYLTTAVVISYLF